jgi:predicted PurR-regulated permease PerM
MGTLVVLLVALGFWFLYQIRLVIFIFFTAIVVGTALRPIVDWLQRRGITPTLATILVCLLLLIFLAALILLLVPLATEQIFALATDLPNYYQDLRNWLLNSPNLLLQQLAWQFPPALPREIPAQDIAAESAEAMSQTFNYADWIFKGAFATVATLVLSFYWILDGQRAIRTLLLLAPIQQREDARELVESMLLKVGAFVRGQTLLCLIIGLLSLIAYLLIGLPYALVLALIAGIMEAVPVVGPVLGALPAVLMAATFDPGKIIWVVVITAIIQQLEYMFLVPRIMDRTVGINPIVTLLALFAFGSIFGILGAILAIPLAAILQLLLNRFLLNSVAFDQQVMEGRDSFSVLRYRVQELISDLRRQVPPVEANFTEALDQVKEEIEAIAADLDSILAQTDTSEALP